MSNSINAHIVGRKILEDGSIQLIVRPEDCTGSRGLESAFTICFPKDHVHNAKDIKRRSVGFDQAHSNYIYEDYETDKTYIEITLNDLGRLIGDLQDQVRHLHAVLEMVDEKEA